MKIAIGSDKSGFSAKEAIKAYLTGSGADFEDLGTVDLNEVHPYYQVADTVAPLVQNGSFDRAILICGTGAGMCVVSNKYRAFTPWPARAYTPPKWPGPSTTPTSSAWAAGSWDPRWPWRW